MYVFITKITVCVVMFFLNAFCFFLLLRYLTNKETSTVLCFVVKHAVVCLPFSYRVLPLPACFTTEQSKVKASLLVL